MMKWNYLDNFTKGRQMNEQGREIPEKRLEKTK